MNRTRWLLVVWLGLAGCLPAAPAQPQAAGPDLGAGRQPPANGSGTTSACDGVTEKGRCELVGGDEMAETCDLAASQVRKIDCTALGKHCVLDAHKGAACGSLPQPGGANGGGAKPPSDGGTSPAPPTPPGTPAKPSTP